MHLGVLGWLAAISLWCAPAAGQGDGLEIGWSVLPEGFAVHSETDDGTGLRQRGECEGDLRVLDILHSLRAENSARQLRSQDGTLVWLDGGNADAPVASVTIRWNEWGVLDAFTVHNLATGDGPFVSQTTLVVP